MREAKLTHFHSLSPILTYWLPRLPPALKRCSTCLFRLEASNLDEGKLMEVARKVATCVGLPEHTAFCDFHPVKLFDFSSRARCRALDIEQPLLRVHRLCCFGVGWGDDLGTLVKHIACICVLCVFWPVPQAESSCDRGRTARRCSCRLPLRWSAPGWDSRSRRGCWRRPRIGEEHSSFKDATGLVPSCYLLGDLATR